MASVTPSRRRRWLGTELLTRVGPFPAVEHIEFADETHGYLVDEADDLEYQQSRAYDAERQPQ